MSGEEEEKNASGGQEGMIPSWTSSKGGKVPSVITQCSESDHANGKIG
jgi:hypothetical protein